MFVISLFRCLFSAVALGILSFLTVFQNLPPRLLRQMAVELRWRLPSQQGYWNRLGWVADPHTPTCQLRRDGWRAVGRLNEVTQRSRVCKHINRAKKQSRVGTAKQSKEKDSVPGIQTKTPQK